MGGGPKPRALGEIAPAVLGAPVHVPEPAEYVGVGAAGRAAGAHSAAGPPPVWAPPPAQRFEAAPEPAVRARYAEVRDLTEGMH
ncbi:hypothetical protein [Mycolicibacterium canariasense]|uniref:hypothetical protein n=1 Tax=Mycolicibacterium canariasense TaxID=228230 RepID=UPI0032D5A6EE